jgi:hypothetical protein
MKEIVVIAIIVIVVAIVMIPVERERRRRLHRYWNEALAKPPRDMGVPPMKHGQDARATPARKGFCRIF